MIYLGEGISIEYDIWERLMQHRKLEPAKFVKELARSLWTTEQLISRSLSGRDNLKMASESTTPRVLVTPIKMKIVEPEYTN